MIKNIPRQQREKSRIPEKATLINSSDTNNSPVFSFKYASQSHCLLSDWRGDELIELINAFKTMESLTWNQVMQHSGLRYKVISNPARKIPADVSPDVSICEVRICKRKRVLGYRSLNVFRIIWFDREHEICPEGKRRHN